MHKQNKLLDKSWFDNFHFGLTLIQIKLNPGYIRLYIGKGKETRGIEKEAGEEREERVEKVQISVFVFK